MAKCRHLSASLIAQTLNRSRSLFNHGCDLLRRLVHLADSLADLRQSARLLGGAGGYIGHDLISFAPLVYAYGAIFLTAQASTRFNGQVVRAGLNYHFNWGAAPVVAKY
jgi:hypothetical protein